MYIIFIITQKYNKSKTKTFKCGHLGKVGRKKMAMVTPAVRKSSIDIF